MLHRVQIELHTLTPTLKYVHQYSKTDIGTSQYLSPQYLALQIGQYVDHLFNLYLHYLIARGRPIYRPYE